MESSAAAPQPTSRLSSMRVLLVEDEFIVALELERIVRELGYSVLGPLSSVAECLELLRSERPDLALLDVRLSDGDVTPVAETLQAVQVPFAIATGYNRELLATPALQRVPWLDKPYSSDEVGKVLAQLIDGHGA